MTGPRHSKAGLVDSLGYLDDAVRLAAGLSKSESAVGRDVPPAGRRGPLALRDHAEPADPPEHAADEHPGLERSKMPLFLYMWQLEPTSARLNGI